MWPTDGCCLTRAARGVCSVCSGPHQGARAGGHQSFQVVGIGLRIHAAQLLERQFGAGWERRLEGVVLVSIGPQTSHSCRELLGRVDAEADPHDLDGLVAACARALGPATG